MKTLNCLLSFVITCLLIGSFASCSEDNGITDPNVDPPTEVVYKTFEIVVEDYRPGDYRLSIELADAIKREFPTSDVSRYQSKITVRMPEKEVDRFNKYMERIGYIISFEELK